MWYAVVLWFETSQQQILKLILLVCNGLNMLNCLNAYRVKSYFVCTDRGDRSQLTGRSGFSPSTRLLLIEPMLSDYVIVIPVLQILVYKNEKYFIFSGQAIFYFLTDFQVFSSTLLYRLLMSSERKDWSNSANLTFDSTLTLSFETNLFSASNFFILGNTQQSERVINGV